jgi:hypothetical protein
VVIAGLENGDWPGEARPVFGAAAGRERPDLCPAGRGKPP